MKEYHRKHYLESREGIPPIEEKDCLWCGATFLPFSRDKKIQFCKYSHGSLFWNKEKRLKNRTWVNKKCIVCSSDFIAPTPSNTICSPECKNIRLKHRQLKTLKNIIVSCVICGTVFHKIGNTNTCSQECRRKYTNKYALKYREKNPIQKLARKTNASLRRSLKGIRKEKPTFMILGYSKEELALHLESQFTEGMTWENQGKWHIDHIRPVDSFIFDSTDHPDFKKCWALNNLKPEWAFDNQSKGNKWDGVVNS